MRMRPPRKWNLPLTYRPKIPGVIAGTIRQTIRPGLKYAPGDLVAFHGWEGRPYLSKWSNRTWYFELHLVIDIRIRPVGIIPLRWAADDPDLINAYPREFHDPPVFPGRRIPWSAPAIDELARLDGIDPPTGQELGWLLTTMYDLPDDGMDFQVLRW